MLFSTIGQIHVFLWMVGAGLLTGALYALCAGIRRLLCAGFWLTLAADVFFGLGAALILILASYLASYGRLRLYELLGALAGFALFQGGVAPILAVMAQFVRRALDRVRRGLAQSHLCAVLFK